MDLCVHAGEAGHAGACQPVHRPIVTQIQSPLKRQPRHMVIHSKLRIQRRAPVRLLDQVALEAEMGCSCEGPHLGVLILCGEEHPGIGKQARQPEGWVHGPYQACKASLLDHPAWAA